MKSLFQDNFKINKTYLVEWYDGIVSGVVGIEGISEWFFISLLAWKQESNEKIYVVVRLSIQRSNEFVGLLSNDSHDKEAAWSLIQEQIEQLRSECQGDVLLIKCHRLGEVNSCKNVDVDEYNLRVQLGKCIEDALYGKEVDNVFKLFKK